MRLMALVRAHGAGRMERRRAPRGRPPGLGWPRRPARRPFPAAPRNIVCGASYISVRQAGAPGDGLGRRRAYAGVGRAEPGPRGHEGKSDERDRLRVAASLPGALVFVGQGRWVFVGPSPRLANPHRPGQGRNTGKALGLVTFFTIAPPRARPAPGPGKRRVAALGPGWQAALRPDRAFPGGRRPGARSGRRPGPGRTCRWPAPP